MSSECKVCKFVECLMSEIRKLDVSPDVKDRLIKVLVEYEDGRVSVESVVNTLTGVLGDKLYDLVKKCLVKVK